MANRYTDEDRPLNVTQANLAGSVSISASSICGCRLIVVAGKTYQERCSQHEAQP